MTMIYHEEKKSSSGEHLEQKKRRSLIQAIMKDPGLTEPERRRSIQSLMDGRRRSSGKGMSMAAAAATVAAAFGNDSDLSDEEDPNHRNSITLNTVSAAGTGSERRSSFSNRDKRRSFNSTCSSLTCNSLQSGGLQQGCACPPVCVSYPPGRRQSYNFYDRDAIHNQVLASYGYGTRFILSYNCEKMERSRPQCNHYQRNCSMIAPCCGLLVGCRVCHDEMEEMPPPIFEKYACRSAEDYALAASQIAVEEDSKMDVDNNNDSSSFLVEDEESQHKLDRFSVREVVCRKCFTRQSSKTNNCIKCGIQFGEYHCAICNLWMSTEGDPYHCTDCGFCRVGGRSNFQHCHECGMCIDINVMDDHGCKSGKYMINCPVCQEDLFSSRSASHEMPCGHAIHWHCFKELTSFDSRCPICKKTADTRENMESTWKAMEMAIALQPIPADLTKVVTTKCIDCENVDEHRSWHFLGNQCLACRSFNTTIEKTLFSGTDAVDFLRDKHRSNQQEQQRQQQQQNSSSQNGTNADLSAMNNSDHFRMNIDEQTDTTRTRRQSPLLEEWGTGPRTNEFENIDSNQGTSQRNGTNNSRSSLIRRVLWNRR